MKKNNSLCLLILYLWLACFSVKGQSILTSSAYLENPVDYLSEVSEQSFNTNILIDRSYFDDDIHRYNGQSQVRNIDCQMWKSNYYALKFAHNDTTILPPFKLLKKHCDNQTSYRRIYPINILLTQFSQINQAEGVHRYTYSDHLYFAATTLNKYVYGDEVPFIFEKHLFHNLTDFEVIELKVDFDDGKGFKSINWEEIELIHYENNTSSEKVIKLQLLIQKPSSQDTEALYAHFTFFRKNTANVPEPDNGILKSVFQSGIPDSDIEQYYPSAPKHIYDRRCTSCPHGTCCTQILVIDQSDTHIRYHILFAPNNRAQKKLRRAIVVCDGFDPGNKRSYYGNMDETIDPRGIYENFNGNPSKNEGDPSRPSAGLAEKLRQMGYDLVFVDFMDGAGNIENNAIHLKGFIQDVLNYKYRDANTEEYLMVGPSMAGLITRRALTLIENEGKEHHVKQWISFDAPHKGANVSIGFQWLIYYFTQIKTAGIGQLEDARDGFVNLLSMVNQPAAKQMVLQHYTNLGNEITVLHRGKHTQSEAAPISQHIEGYAFYKRLESLNNDRGYPLHCLRYAITNGGKKLRYESQNVRIAKFKIFEWTHAFAYGSLSPGKSSKFFQGWRQNNWLSGYPTDYGLFTKSLPYEHAPGGGYAMNGLLNYHAANKYNVPHIPQYEAFTFMPTPTTLGIEIDAQNIYKTWDQFDAKESPFDAFWGMKENENHVQITDHTAQKIFIQNILGKGQSESYVPIKERGDTLHRIIRRPVTFTAHDRLLIAFGENKLTIRHGNQVNMVTGKRIDLFPGSKLEKGSNVRMFVKNQPGLKSMPSSEFETTQSINYRTTLTKTNTVYNYIEGSQHHIQNKKSIDQLQLKLWPVPANDELNISLKKKHQQGIKYKIHDLHGRLLETGNIEVSGILQISHLKPGVYILKILNGQGGFYQSKFLKQ